MKEGSRPRELGGNSIGFFDSPKLGDRAQSWVTSPPLSPSYVCPQTKERERGEVTQLWAWSPNSGLSKNPIELPPCAVAIPKMREQCSTVMVNISKGVLCDPTRACACVRPNPRCAYSKASYHTIHLSICRIRPHSRADRAAFSSLRCAEYLVFFLRVSSVLRVRPSFLPSFLGRRIVFCSATRGARHRRSSDPSIHP